ncbi:hypothetical protein [Archangium sp.]|uniref:hypothetical protein n=1 Tax=Archangium sp. TaxID=1872627 RepID=UPI002D39A7B7|nr:hypothetical protein [Archangium sp.]HYO59939.1 hypothetical protein [Archangium sp.]
MSVHYQGHTRGAGHADARGPREMNRRQRAKTVIELESRRATATETARAPAKVLEPDPLYGVALLKMALELKRRQDGTPEEILRGVLARMRLPEDEFRAWLSQQGELSKVLGGTP